MKWLVWCAAGREYCPPSLCRTHHRHLSCWTERSGTRPSQTPLDDPPERERKKERRGSNRKKERQARKKNKTRKKQKGRTKVNNVTFLRNDKINTKLHKINHEINQITMTASTLPAQAMTEHTRCSHTSTCCMKQCATLARDSDWTSVL